METHVTHLKVRGGGGGGGEGGGGEGGGWVIKLEGLLLPLGLFTQCFMLVSVFDPVLVLIFSLRLLTGFWDWELLDPVR